MEQQTPQTPQIPITIDVSDLYGLIGYLTAEKAALTRVIHQLQAENLRLQAGHPPEPAAPAE